ncbi:lactoylglutathione lyase [Cucurbita pepo subsp. pepo]|uniref:lactoylglutathione lyase n=1 Tax=Cucurbita pepo subsp. pepo TaxID=3664 RepID=UPI000C9D64B7|nr:lactoylglutathione lyase [Cucurbita pepo subsp. pepo]
MEKEIADRKATVDNEVQEKNDGESEEITERESTRKEEEHPLPLMALNHVSRVCSSVKDSVDFYTKVLGFVLIERPQSFDFEGAWLFNYGVGIHLMQSEDEDNGVRQGDKDHLDPLDNHISFQCEDMEAMEERLKELGVKYMRRTLDEENGESIEQLFFNDPDGFMIEICNCENLKVVPAGSSGRIRLPAGRHNPPLESNGQK